MTLGEDDLEYWIWESMHDICVTYVSGDNLIPEVAKLSSM